MAILKEIKRNGVGFVRAWRVDNVQYFRNIARVALAGWATLEDYTNDLEKKEHIAGLIFDVENKPERFEPADKSILHPTEETEGTLIPATTEYTDFFSNDALQKPKASLLINAYKYVMTLPEFEGGEEIK